MTQYTLPRSGDVPVVFSGDELFKDDTRRNNGPGQNRWHEVTLYRTGKRRYVLAITYVSQWAGEDEHNTVLVCESPESLRNSIREFNPVPPNVGYPEGQQYAYKQARLHQDLQSRFDKLIGDMMMRIATEVAERID